MIGDVMPVLQCDYAESQYADHQQMPDPPSRGGSECIDDVVLKAAQYW
ncbi:uncharacterized protein METZ01_LOCUS72032 [marine metagenome]|uniref:Uncharacterized protein n=1 Tax=marine metagenome TaxID=408172 RepID=A0A381TUJ9_9ZZZZ